jgi:uncharacterized protein (DUF885 family)
MKAIRLLAVVLALVATPIAQSASDDRARVTALADRFVQEYERNFPLSFAFSGLPAQRNDGLEINSPAEITRWQTSVKGMSGELASINPDAFADAPEWVTWQFLDHAFRQNLSTAACRNELWSVSSLGWQSSLSQIAAIQPVGTDEARAQALARWRALGPWVDQEIANLQEGLRLGYLATEAATQSTLKQLDAMLTEAPGESSLMEPATRDGTPAFAAEWKEVIAGTVWPALTRYRDFLRDKYVAHARKSPSLDGMPGGRECYRALAFAVTTVDADPEQLFERALQQIEREHQVALDLGRKLYGDKATDWKALSDLMRADPGERFASTDEVRDFTQRTYERAEAAAAKMVLTPPAAKVVLEPFPEFQQATAPGGQYIPAADDGSRPAKYLYRNVTADLYRSALQNVILHETLPGHHLQQAILAEHGRKGNHPVARLLYFSGPGEGWATYAEDFARELGLYDSDRDYIGAQMSSITPMMVVDLGMQVKGWTAEQAVKYLQDGMPLRPPQRAEQSVALISSLPSLVLSYPLGGIKWQEMRARAEKELGDRFDVRAFHQVLLEDGMLPFAALDAKLDRWIASQR